MSRRQAPSMPTEAQIKAAHQAVAKLHPEARIRSVGPDGVAFDYPDEARNDTQYRGAPFAPVRK